MNTTLRLNTISNVRPHPVVASRPVDLPKIPWWLRIFACFYLYADDPTALRYTQSKYSEGWD